MPQKKQDNPETYQASFRLFRTAAFYLKKVAKLEPIIGRAVIYGFTDLKREGQKRQVHYIEIGDSRLNPTGSTLRVEVFMVENDKDEGSSATFEF